MRLKNDAPSSAPSDWRQLVTKPTSVLNIGGFRPSGEQTASYFGEIRVIKSDEVWPTHNGKSLWPVCQLNLTKAPFVPANLTDLSMIQVFVAEDCMLAGNVISNSSDKVPNSPFFIRCYRDIDALQPAVVPDHGSSILPFEARWNDDPSTDYPTHDTMPIDFDALGIGDFYDQDGIDGVWRTKIGGWPSCIQSEPWWDYREDGAEFEFALQINSEDKSKCWWGDGGSVYIARHRSDPNLWAFDTQCF